MPTVQSYEWCRLLATIEADVLAEALRLYAAKLRATVPGFADLLHRRENTGSAWFLHVAVVFANDPPEGEDFEKTYVRLCQGIDAYCLDWVAVTPALHRITQGSVGELKAYHRPPKTSIALPSEPTAAARARAAMREREEAAKAREKTAARASTAKPEAPAPPAAPAPAAVPEQKALW